MFFSNQDPIPLRVFLKIGSYVIFRFIRKALRQYTILTFKRRIFSFENLRHKSSYDPRFYS